MSDMQERRMSRRGDDKAIQELVIKEEESRTIAQTNQENIKYLQADVTTIITTVDKLAESVNAQQETIQKQQETIEPVVGLMQDIGAVARFGRLVKSLIIWLTVVGGGIVAFGHSFTDWFKST